MKKLILTLLAAMILSACSDGGSSSSGSAVGAGSLQVVMKLAAKDVGDGLVLVGKFGGEELVHDTILLNAISDSTISINLTLESGTWSFQAFVYDSSLVVQQSEEYSVEVGEKSTLEISLVALYGYVNVEVYLGLGNQIGMESGTVVFVNASDSSVSYDFVLGDPYAYAYCGPLKFGNYTVTITLYTSDDALSETKEITLSSGNSSISWVFGSSDSEGSSSSGEGSSDSDDSSTSSLGVTITLDENDTTSVSALVSAGGGVKALDSLDTDTLTASYKGKVLISEVYVINSSGYRFMEIYNGSVDSISLEGCVIKDGTSGGNKNTLSGIKLGPSDYYSIGGANSEASDKTLDDKVLPSQASKTVLILCNSVVIDSVFFTYVSDSKDESTLTDSVKVYNGQSTHLILSQWENHLSSSAWCNSSTSTPGAAAPDECVEESGNSDDSSGDE